MRNPSAGQPQVRSEPVRPRLRRGDGRRAGEVAQPSRRDGRGSIGKVVKKYTNKQASLSMLIDAQTGTANGQVGRASSPVLLRLRTLREPSLHVDCQ